MSHESSQFCPAGPVQSDRPEHFRTTQPSAQNCRKIDPELPADGSQSEAKYAAEFPAFQELAAKRGAEEMAQLRAGDGGISGPVVPAAVPRIEPPGGGEPAPVPQVAVPDSQEVRQRRRGRPTSVDDETQHKVVALLGAGVSLNQSAGILGIARSTLFSALERDDEFAEEVRQARQRAQVYPLNCILREASRNWRAAAWLMSYFERQQERERSRREQVLEKADELIQRDVAQDLRTQARGERLADAAADEEEQAEPPRRPRRK